jgi:1-acyl-sn-glycerol-3-phosphate acyltransferase
MPPVKNHALYLWRVFGKWLAFFVFGLGTLFLALMVFPLMRLFIRERIRFQRYARKTVSLSFRTFTVFMDFIDIVKLETEDLHSFTRLGGRILVANHPSLLDVVMLISLIPNADCIVNGALLHSIVRNIIRQLYIPNTLDFTTLSRLCAESLERGNCLLIFPEGTRTRRYGPIKVQKGAARISLLSGSPVVPVCIGGNDKWGLGKKDPWIAFNHIGPYRYELTLLDEISPERYISFSYNAAVKLMNDEIKKALFRHLDREIL